MSQASIPQRQGGVWTAKAAAVVSASDSPYAWAAPACSRLKPKRSASMAPMAALNTRLSSPTAMPIPEAIPARAAPLRLRPGWTAPASARKAQVICTSWWSIRPGRNWM